MLSYVYLLDFYELCECINEVNGKESLDQAI